MLDKCSEIAEVISLEFDVEKSHCVVIGKNVGLIVKYHP